MSELSIKLDFVILNMQDPKSIFVGDISQWGVAFQHPSYLSVIPPGSSNEINTQFVKQQFNILTSTNLGLTCSLDCEQEDLDDGIWEFCLRSNFDGINKRRLYLKDDSLRADIDKIYIKQNLRYDETSKVIQELQKIEFFLSSAQAYIKKGEKVWAERAYETAKKYTEKYLTCKDCK